MSQTREEWLEARRQGIGASDIAAVCGLSPYSAGPLEVYLDKLGLLPPRESQPMRWGLLLEDVIAAGYQELTGVGPMIPALHIQHPHYPWILATPDRACGKGLVELKTARTAEGWGEQGTDEVPEGYLLQCQWQMLAAAHLGVESVDVCVLIGGSDLRLYTVPKHEEIQEQLLRIGGEFWRRVQAREPPEPNWSHAETPRLIELLHRPVAGVEIALDDDAATYAALYEDLGEDIREREKSRAFARARLAQAMGEASVGILPEGGTVTRKVIEVKGHTRAPSQQVRYTIRSPKIGAAERSED